MKKTLTVNITKFRKAAPSDIRQIIVHDLSTVRVEIPVKRKYSPAMETALKTVAGIQ